MNPNDPNTLQQHLPDVTGMLPDWISVVRFSSIFTIILLLFWLWRSGGRIHPTVLLIVLGLCLVSMLVVDIEVIVIAHRIDWISTLVLIPFAIIGVKMIFGSRSY